MHKWMKYFEQASVRLSAFALGLVVYLMTSPLVMAQDVVTVDDVAENIVESSNTLPGLLTGMAYMIGLILCVQGILKLKDHVENPSQNPLRTPVIRFLVGGGLFALPIVSNSMRTMILGTFPNEYDPSGFSFGALISGLVGSVNFGHNVNGILKNIIEGVSRMPGLFTALAYAIGLLSMVTGAMKLKDHVENPSQTPLRESIMRFLAGGALFALPLVMTVANKTVSGDNIAGTIFQNISELFKSISFIKSPFSKGVCTPEGASLGDVVCTTTIGSAGAIAFLSAISYAFGIVLVIWAILKMRDHVVNPQQVKVSEPVSRFLAGGMFLSLPVIVGAIRATVMTPTTSIVNILGTIGGTKYNESDNLADCQGLDGALACFMNDTLGPIHGIVNFFAYVAGMIFIMIGISRLMKGAQEGAKGPGGIGTMMTFATGGMLISFNELMKAFAGSFFGVAGLQTKAYAKLQYVQGMTDAEQLHAHTVISAIIKFMIVVGIISFVRGLFIVRGVAEGSGQASPMAAITHLVGGALAVNLGPLINAVQTTLGITQYGITFT